MPSLCWCVWVVLGAAGSREAVAKAAQRHGAAVQARVISSSRITQQARRGGRTTQAYSSPAGVLSAP